MRDSYGKRTAIQVEMMEERGLEIPYTTIMRWVHQYGPELDTRI